MKKTFKTYLLGLLALAFLASCAHQQKPSTPSLPPYTPSLNEVAFSVMTYNVENLFDLTNDPKKDDDTFLPLSEKKSKKHIAKCNKIEVAKWKDQCLNWDWNKEALSKKLDQLAQVIRSANFGKGPDLLIFQEIENESILKQLRNTHLSDLGYQSLVLIEGRDKRGIDVAFMSRFKVIGKPILHAIPFPGVALKRVQDTRGILEATFELPDQTPLTAFAVHFPAPFHPADMRVSAFKELNKIAAKLPQGRLYLAGGDFNLAAEEDLRDKVLENYVQPTWNIAHQLGCQNCKGTNYYAPKNSWSFLDMIIFSKSFGASPWNFRDIRIINDLPFQKTKNNEPDGVSDHWPIQVIFSQAVSTI